MRKVMIKTERGVTMITLIIVIIVMVILAGIAVTTITNLRKKTELSDRVTQMQLIQAKAEDIYNEHLYSGTDLLGTSTTIDGETWYKLSQEDLDTMGIDFDCTDELYYCVKYDLSQEESGDDVNKEKTEDIDVYYSGGYKSTNDSTYYLLSELKNLES